MKDHALSSAHTVRDPAAAAIFTNSRLRRILMLFAGEPRSVSEAAIASGIGLKQLHHHVRKLVGLGLLEVVAERRRAGRPLKLYRSRGTSFFIPEEIAPKPFHEELAVELRHCLAAANRRASRGMLLSLSEGGQPLASMLTEEHSAPDGVEMWRILRLTSDEVRALRGEMRAVLDRFERATSGRGNVYLVHGAIARRGCDAGSADNDRPASHA